MSRRTRSTVAGAAGALVLLGLTTARADAPHRSSCRGAYAADLSALSAHARDLEEHGPTFSYAVRTTATYECVAYAPDGGLKHSKHAVAAYGTAFGLRRDGAGTLLVTNDHVASWPAVTDAEHAVDGVPPGCKRVAGALWIVDNDNDHYAADDIPLVRVVDDPQLDLAVLRARTRLAIIPWKIGRSGGLAARDVVEVKGFPLGEFRATNVGKVISAYDHDDYGDWNHDDFVIDALLSEGNSGSPVLAVSCATGEFELVGVFHAAYAEGSALNVVIAIDQARDLLATLKRTPHPRPGPPTLDAAARTRITEIARGAADPPYFEIGPVVGSVRARKDGALVFALFAPDFPKRSQPWLVIEDLPATGGRFGELGGVYLGGGPGLHRFVAASAEDRALIHRALEAFRLDALAEFDLRRSAATANASREAFERHAQRRLSFHRALAGQHDLVHAIGELAGRGSTKSTGAAVTLAQVESGAPDEDRSPPHPAPAKVVPGHEPRARAK
jgi:S1-C subfamily serine protease